MRRWIDSGGALALLVLIVYVAIAPSEIVAADNAEFATLGSVGGRAHPSGYPLYVLWLRAWSWLPVSGAHATAIATAILGAAAIWVLFLACRAWGANAASAGLAAAIVAAAPAVLRVHTAAEVFALNGLVAATVLWLAAERGPLRGMRRAVALALVAGLGLSDHMSCVLVAPIGLVGAVRGVRESGRAVIAVAASVGALVVGLLPYLYLVVADGPASWGTIASASDLWRFATRADYGTFSLLSGGRDVPLSHSVGAMAATVGRVWLYVPALAGVAMLALGTARGTPAASRLSWGALALAWLLAGPVFASQLNIEPDDVGRYIVSRFHLLPALVLAVPVAVAFNRVLAHPRAWLAAPVAFVALVGVALPRLARVDGSTVADGVRALLDTAPDRAVIAIASEDQCFGMEYLQRVQHDRPDVDVVCTLLWPQPWYRARFSGLPEASGVAFADAVTASGRPLIVDGSDPQVLAALPSYPYGVGYRVLARGQAPPSLHDVVVENRTLFAKLPLGTPPPREDDFAAAAYRRYAQTWAHLAVALEKAGANDDARDAAELARSLAPE